MPERVSVYVQQGAQTKHDGRKQCANGDAKSEAAPASPAVCSAAGPWHTTAPHRTWHPTYSGTPAFQFFITTRHRPVAWCSYTHVGRPCTCGCQPAAQQGRAALCSREACGRLPTVQSGMTPEGSLEQPQQALSRIMHAAGSVAIGAGGVASCQERARGTFPLLPPSGMKRTGVVTRLLQLPVRQRIHSAPKRGVYEMVLYWILCSFSTHRTWNHLRPSNRCAEHCLIGML